MLLLRRVHFGNWIEPYVPCKLIHIYKHIVDITSCILCSLFRSTKHASAGRSLGASNRVGRGRMMISEYSSKDHQL